MGEAKRRGTLDERKAAATPRKKVSAAERRRAYQKVVREAFIAFLRKGLRVKK